MPKIEGIEPSKTPENANFLSVSNAKADSSKQDDSHEMNMGKSEFKSAKISKVPKKNSSFKAK